MNETLTLNDGTVLNGHALKSGSDLFLYVYGSSLAELYPLVSDAEKTVKIDEDRYGDLTTYTGYNYLYCIREELTGMVSAGLRKVTENG